jgi:hypothetical protein
MASMPVLREYISSGISSLSQSRMAALGQADLYKCWLAEMLCSRRGIAEAGDNNQMVKT